MSFKNIVVAASAILSVASAFEGDGTFYGAGGAGSAGACMLQPGFNGVGVTVAMNVGQFENGLVCGKCVKLTGQGQGLGTTPIIGPIFATIDNECPECKFGDVDLGLGGDGRWHINWEFVDCAEARAAGSHLPVMRMGNRQLRGAAASAAAEQTSFLAPGYMVTSDGIRLIADVQAEQPKLVVTPEDAAAAAPATEGGKN